MIHDRRSGCHVFDVAVILILAGTSIAFTLLAGKDLNFDQLNYHFYIAHSMLHDRLQQDFAAANGQSFLNPLAYVPFYWMVKNGWHSIVVASLLALFHSLNLVVAYFISKAVLPANLPYSRWLASLGAILALLAPVYLNEVGTTFADVTSSVFVMGALLCALRANMFAGWWRDPSFATGILLGIAGGLKLSNLVFGPAFALLLVLVLTSQGTVRQLRSLILLGLGTTVGFILAHGYWSWQLWQATGNPLFPYFAGHFPETNILPKQGAMLERFLPSGIWDALTLPFRMMQIRSWVYIESISPDLRFAALAVLTLLGTSVWLLMRRGVSDSDNSRRALALAGWFVLAYVLWQWTSGNGRYGIVVSLICGPLLAVVAYTLCRSPRGALASLLVLTGLQVLHLQHASLRWSSGPWTASWYEPVVPERLAREPFLYISIGNNSNSFIYPYLAEGSAFTNAIGQIAFELEGAGGSQIRALLDKYDGRVRMLGTAPPPGADEISLPTWIEMMDDRISRLELAVDADDCETIFAAGPPEIGQDFNASMPYTRRLLSCRVIERPFEFAEERRRLTQIAQEVIEWCPKLFKPAYTVLERSRNSWFASYPSTDSRMLIADGVIYGMFARSAADIKIARVDEWQKGLRPSCSDFPDVPREFYRFD